MGVRITSLKTIDRESPGGDGFAPTPYIIVNITFNVLPDEETGNFLFQQAKAESESYRQFVDVGDPESYELHLERVWQESDENVGTWMSRLNPLPQRWTYQDPSWIYLEKFDTFWFREWIASGPVTKAILNELNHYYLKNRLQSRYRTLDGQIVLEHIRTLQRYWD